MTKERNHIIAHICLTDGTVKLRQAEDTVIRQYLGGRGLGMHLLQSCTDRNPLLFLTGPLTVSTAAPGGRYCAVTRSADSGFPVSLSSGTCWGVILQRAGLYGIVIEGEAPEWAYIAIENGTVRVLSAQAYIGMRSGETSQALKAIYAPDSAVLCIGPAGEKLVPMAAILCNTERAFSRAGIGKIMGAKKLKAIVVHADHAGDIPENACIRCTVPCRNAHRNPQGSVFSSLCNEYGLDSISTAKAIDNDSDALFPRLAEADLATLRKAYRAEPMSPKTRAKQQLPEEIAAVLDSIGSCLFSASAFSIEDYANMLTDATGEKFSPEELGRIGKQILELEQRGL